MVFSPGFTAINTGGFFNIGQDDGGYFMRGYDFAHCGSSIFANNNYFGFAAGNHLTTTAGGNTACGGFSMEFIANGASENSSLGYQALTALTTGRRNTGIGAESMASITTAIRNSSLGALSLANLISGSYNLALGFGAGINYETAESSNICIGNEGVLGENNTIRIGTDGAAPNQQNKCYIAGDVYAARSLNSTNGTFANSVTVGTANILSGAGDPNGVFTATKGSLYLNLTGSGAADRAWINTNSGTAWTNLVTAA